jgi:hypothetical protein
MSITLFALVSVFILTANAQVNQTPAAPQVTPKPEAPLSAVEKKPLLAKFKRLLSDQEKVLERDQNKSLNDFTIMQSQQLKNWRNQEKTERQIFFDEHLSGPDRRTYVQSYIARKKDFDQKQSEDSIAFRQSMLKKQDAFKANEKKRETQFQTAIDHNLRPPETLWTP